MPESKEVLNNKQNTVTGFIKGSHEPMERYFNSQIWNNLSNKIN